MKDFDKDIMELFFDKVEDEIKEEPLEYDKYMVIADKGAFEEAIYGVYDYEIDALRRGKEVKEKKKRVSIIRANIEYTSFFGQRMIYKYTELSN